MELTPAFPIVRHPAPGTRTAVLVSVPHYGTLPLPHITRDDYSEPWFETFPYGFARFTIFAADLYSGHPRARRHRAGHAVLADVRRRQPPPRRLSTSPARSGRAAWW
jgi:hypothetical protein